MAPAQADCERRAGDEHGDDDVGRGNNTRGQQAHVTERVCWEMRGGLLR
jgi:hypothetical protein